MQKCFLVSNKITQVREYLEHRSIVEVTEEHRSLTELDLTHLGIIDVDKVIYIYYATDDGDLAFRSDLNILRQLLSSAFFHTDEGIFILVDCKNPMLEDLIHSACRDTNLIGSHLNVIHHTGVLTLSDVSKYIAGSVIGAQTTSSYKAVYVKEEESEERERYANVSNGIDSVLPMLTDQYAMYQKRASIEAISSSRTVNETFIRPQTMRNFAKRNQPVVHQWKAFLLSGELHTGFERGVNYLLDYYSRVGSRCMVIDLTSSETIMLVVPESKLYSVAELSTKSSFSERAGLIKCRYNQLGYVVEMLDNVAGVDSYIFVCDSADYSELRDYLNPLCEVLYSNYVTHFLEESLKDYVRNGLQATTLFLSRVTIHRPFEVLKYKEHFSGTRVAAFDVEDVDTTDYYECATGGGL